MAFSQGNEEETLNFQRLT